MLSVSRALARNFQLHRGLHSTALPVVPTTAFQDLFGSKSHQVEDALKRTCVQDGSMEMTYSTPPPLGGMPKGQTESVPRESRHWEEENATQSEASAQGQADAANAIVHALRESETAF